MIDKFVEFKSVPENYKKEESGSKPNTIRKLPMGGDREKTLRRWASLVDYGQIRIMNTVSGISFTREVTDVTIWEGWMIISWKHQL